MGKKRRKRRSKLDRLLHHPLLEEPKHKLSDLLLRHLPSPKRKRSIATTQKDSLPLPIGSSLNSPVLVTRKVQQLNSQTKQEMSHHRSLPQSPLPQLPLHNLLNPPLHPSLAVLSTIPQLACSMELPSVPPHRRPQIPPPLPRQRLRLHPTLPSKPILVSTISSAWNTWLWHSVGNSTTMDCRNFSLSRSRSGQPLRISLHPYLPLYHIFRYLSRLTLPLCI